MFFKKRRLGGIFLFVLFTFFTGCSNKTINIKTKLPAQNPILLKKKTIAILPLKNDNINFRDMLETKLNTIYCNNNPCFILVNRDKIKEMLNELKLQASDLSANKQSNFGKLIGTNVIITGSIKNNKSDKTYHKPISYCAAYTKKGKCLYYSTTYKICKISKANLNVNLKAIDVKTSKILDTYTFNKTLINDSCNKYYFKTSEELNYILINQALEGYINKIAPHYTFFYVQLIDKVDSIDLTNKQEEIFDNALTYIEHGRLKNAELLLKKLNLQTNSKSFEILYNIGLVEEALGNYQQAYSAYKMANSLILKNNLEPNELIDKAIIRIEHILEKQKELQRQLNEKN